MPTKKQRRRRAKGFRHEYDFVVEDEEGNEVPVESSELRAERNQRDKERAATKPARTQSSRGGRGTREPTPPSWQRAMRRGGIMGGLMLLAFVFLFKSAPIAVRLGWGVFYAAAFVPLTYFIDRTAYRSYQKRLARTTEKKSEKKKAA
jgi:hypothetical protein